MSIVDNALFYAKQGWQVFPLKARDKTPVVKWADVCTTEANMINGWFEFQPDANLGIATGSKSGITVLDVDADHDGYESLAELLTEYGPLPVTPTAKTGGGGEHIFFKYVPGTRNSTSKLGKGLDLRSEGGYVVGAGSIHPNGKPYEWVVKPSQTPLAEMPDWMVEMLKEKNVIVEPQAGTGDIIAGERNMALTKVAGSMRRKGLSEDAIFQALTIHNREKCSPPLLDGEVLQIARSVTRYPPQDEYKPTKALPDAWDVIDTLEVEIKERQKNPVDVWGIHYAWDFLSIVTGGKQKGEFEIIAGEPGVGKSYWALQDALFSAIGDPSKKIPSTSTAYWCGEMGRKQIFRRFFEMLGVQKRSMRTGNMSDTDWQFFNEAKALIVNSPIYVSDVSLDLKEVRPMLEREIAEHGIEQAYFDYDWLINAPGTGEIEQSQNISRAMKQIARDLNIHVTLISSVNKMGMDSLSEHITKSNVSGSGKKLHDADVIYILTKFNEKKNSDLSIHPNDYPKIATLHISKGRELDWHLPNGAINYIRETPNPKFREMKDVTKPNALPEWMTRKDM